MKSKIINMAEKIKDADDQMLEALLGSEPITDNGFSGRIVRKIRRRLWVRRLTLPIAAAIGAAVSLKPLSSLVAMLFGFVKSLPVEVVTVSTSWIPPVPMIALGGVLFAVLMFCLRLLEE